jgi:hypothetical protein
MRELIDYAKKSSVNMGAMPQAPPAMVADQTNRSEGANKIVINYRGESPMWVDGGQLQVALAVTSLRDGPRAAQGHRRDEAPTAPQVPRRADAYSAGLPPGHAGGAACHHGTAGTPEAVPLRALNQWL